MRLIDADKIKYDDITITNARGIVVTRKAVMQRAIEDMPTIERPKGKWIDTEPILDKIRAEIKDMFPPLGIWMYGEGGELEHTVCETLGDVLKIIDKYKAEMEGVAKNATTTEEAE